MAERVRVGVIGARGYVGGEIVRLLLGHPRVEITSLAVKTGKDTPIVDIYPGLRGRIDRTCVVMTDIGDVVREVDVVFLALPHTVSMKFAPALWEKKIPILDTSADFRLSDPEIYEKWYEPHTAKDLIPHAVYGLPELHREKIRAAKLVGVPGCYPTSIILGLAPLLKAGAIRPDTIIADSMSGVSGAGSTPSAATHFPETNENVRAYSVGGTHRHIPEIEQELSGLAGETVRVSFTPHIAPMSRGILSTIYAQAATPTLTAAGALSLYREFYRGEPFVRVLPDGKLAEPRFVRGTNYCDIGVARDERTGRFIVTSAIDNLVKGAAGQAVQDLNLVCGFPETSGLEMVGIGV